MKLPSRIGAAILFSFILSSIFMSQSTSALYSIGITTDEEIVLNTMGGSTEVTASDVNVITNCQAGYNLSLATPAANNLYLGGDSSSEHPYFTPVNSTYPLNDNANNANTWGYSMTGNVGTAGAFVPLSSTPSFIKTTSTTATELEEIDDTFSVYYGVNADMSILPGSYHMANEGGITYYLTAHESCVNTAIITFNKNLDGEGSQTSNDPNDTVSNFPETNENVADEVNYKLTLSSKIPTRSGYTFAGWNTEPDGSGHTYSPAEIIEIGDDEGQLLGFVTLYAIWLEPVTLEFNGGGFYFDTNETEATNTVQYASVYTPHTGYIGNTPSISKTPNVGNDGSASSGYAYNFTQNDPISFPGASQLKVELVFGIEERYDQLYVFDGTYSGEINDSLSAGQIRQFSGGVDYITNTNHTGEASFLVNGDTVSFVFFGDDNQDDGYYGYYAKVYPIYSSAHTNATYGTFMTYDWQAIQGTYNEPISGDIELGRWYAETIDYDFDPTEESIISALQSRIGAEYAGQTLTVEPMYSNAVKVDFRSNGLYFDNAKTKNINTVLYTDVCTDQGGEEVCSWQAVAGQYQLPILGNVEFTEWSNNRLHSTFEDESEILSMLESDGDNYYGSTLLMDATYNAVTINYGGNGLYFDNAKTKDTNTVFYANTCTTHSIYVGSNYEEAMSANISAGGVKEAAYTTANSPTIEPITISGADRLKVVVDYGLTASTGGVVIVEGDLDGNSAPEKYYELFAYNEDISGTNTYMIEGDTVTIYGMLYGTPNSGYDYGYYVRVYPVYNEPHQGATADTYQICGWQAVEGTYQLPVLGYSNFTNWQDAFCQIDDSGGGGAILMATRAPSLYCPSYTNEQDIIYNISNGSFEAGDVVNLVANYEGPITFTFHGNGLYFDANETETTNTVTYANTCSSLGSAYVGEDYEEVMSSNLSTGGVQNGSYDTETILRQVTLNGADRLKVVVSYGLDRRSGGATIVEGSWDGSSQPSGDYHAIDSSSGAGVGSETYIIDGDTTTVQIAIENSTPIVTMMSTRSAPNNTDYGVYVQIYPVYDEPQAGATYESLGEYCGWQAVEGAYEPVLTPGANTVFDYWYSNYLDTIDDRLAFVSESGIINSLPDLANSFSGQTIDLYANWYQAVSATVNLGAHVRSISFYNENDGVETVVNNNGNGDGTDTVTINLRSNASYTISASYDTGYVVNAWATTANGTLGNTTDAATSYVLTGPATLSLTSQLKQPAASCSTPVPNVTYMQDITANNYGAIMNSLTTNEAYYLRDSRDNEPYCVSKLVDGRLWMLDNLALDLVARIDDLSSSNTNASNTTLDYLKNGGGSTSDSDPTYKYAKASVANWTSTIYNNYYSDPLVNISYSETVPNDAPANGKGGNMIGGYYNFCAASAGSYCYGNGTNYGTSTGDATEDICPSNWRLPTGYPNSEFGALANAIYGSTGYTSDATNVADYRNALSLPLSGYFSYGYPNDYDYSGYWWSSTRRNNYNMYYLSATTSDLSPEYSSFNRSYGFSIRCIKDIPSHTVTVSLDPNLSSVTFTNGDDIQTATANNPTVSLKDTLPYTITATANIGYEIATWSTTANGSLESTTANPTTYTIIGNATLSTTSQIKQPAASCSTPVPNITYMQDINANNYSTVMNSLTTNEAYYLRDSRDNEPYCVSKLADGRLWMLDNLSIDLVVFINDLNENNTNASNTTLGYLKNGGGSTSDSDPTYKYAKASVANWTSSYSYSDPLINLSDKDTVPNNAPSNGKGRNMVGGYYNFCAASAGSYCYGDGTNSGTSTGDATEDICPAGWRLPTGYTGGEFSTLANAIYGANGSTSNSTAVTNFRNALSLPLSGYINSSSPSGQGSYGGWWSSKRTSNNYRMYNLRAETSSIKPADYDGRNYGYSIRCILDAPTHSVTVSLDSHVSSVLFTGGGTTQTVTTSNPTISLLEGISYTVTAAIDTSYELVNWSTTANGTLGSATVNPTTYTISGDTTLTVTSQQAPTYTVTVNLDEHTNSVSFYNADLGTQITTNQDSNGDGSHTGTVTLYRGVEYVITGSFANSYKFASWTSTSDATIGSTLSAATTYTITGIATLSLASQYKQPAASCNTPVPNITYMQDINANNYSTVMNSLTTNEAYYLRDSRDGEPYCVSKLADGRLWMLDNLALDILDPNILNSLSSSNTNIDSANESDILTSLKTGNRSAGDQYANGAIGKITGETTYSAARANLDYKDSTPENLPANGKGRNLIGGYYNFCAASAGSYCNGDGTGSGAANGNATNDICPAGWRLPTGDTSGEYSALAYFIYGSTNYSTNITNVTNYRNALSLPLSGTAGTDSGNWWSSTNANSSSSIHTLVAQSNRIYPRYQTSYRSVGLTIRCIADAPIHSVTVSLDSHVSSVSFTSGDNTQTATASNPTVSLMENNPYTVTANIDATYELANWSTTANGTLGSTTVNPTNYTISGDTTLTVISQQAPSYTVTVNLDEYTNSVSFYNADLGTQTITNQDNNGDGTHTGTVTLYRNTEYIISSSFVVGGEIVNWISSGNATIGSVSSASTTYVITDTTTLSIASQLKQPAASCGTPVPNITYMQDINANNYTSVMNSLTANEAYYLRDSRDNEPYCVSKLADGRLWMLDNLALDLVARKNDLNDNNTNASNTTLSYLKNGGGGTGQYAASGITNWTINTSTYSVPKQKTERIDYVPLNPPSNGKGSNKAGIYYNFCAASAGSYCYGTSTSPYTSSGNATEDICPVNWRMPTGSTSGEFSALAKVIYGTTGSTTNSTAIANYRDTLSLPFSGTVNNGNIVSLSSSSGWWSSTRYSNSNMYALSVSTSLYPATDDGRNYGRSIRCVADAPPDIRTVTVSLDTNISSVSFTSINDTQTATSANPAVLLDSNTTYTITATANASYELANWSTTANGTLGSATVNPTTYTISGDTTLTVTSQQAPTYTVTVNLDEHTNSVSFYNADLGTQITTNQDSNGDGSHTGTVTLYRGTEYTISSSFAASYKFASWTSTGDATIGSTSSASTTYTITGTATLSLTSQLKQPAASCNTPVPNITYMQDINANNYSTVMNSLTTNEAYYLRDSRDGEPYCVSKLADGRLWMLDNLALDILDPNILNSLSSSNTNIDSANESDILTSLKTGNRSAGDQYANGAIGSLAEGDSYYSYSVARANLNYKDIVPNNAPANGKGGNKIGGYYNFCAASAGSYCYGNNTGEGTSTGDAASSICPKGWRLPTGSSSGEFGALFNSITGASYIGDALSLPLSGFFASHSNNLGYSGEWWSSTRHYNSMATLYGIRSDTSLSNSDRSHGHSIRCIIDTPIHSVTVSLDSNISSITFTGSGKTHVATATSPTISLLENVPYTITANIETSYELANWSTTANGTLGSTTVNPTTYTISGDTTLTVISQQAPSYTVTVNLDEYTNSVSFYNADLGTQTITNQDNNGDGTHTGTTTLYRGVEYTIAGSFTPGYTFTNWTSAGSATIGSTSSASTTYSITGTATLSLASHLRQPAASCNTPVPNITYMQDINANNYNTVMNSLTTNEAYYLRDSRDNEPYCVSKLADGRLWMLDNLALDILNPSILNNLSSSNTNIDSTNESDILTSLKTGNRSAGYQYANGAIGNLTEGNSYSVARANLDYRDTVPTNTPTNGKGGNKVGGYYNFCAASAGSYCNGNGASDSGLSGYSATSSICPKGWRLPAGRTSKEFSVLANSIYGSIDYTSDATAITNYRNALSLPLSGYFISGAVGEQNNISYWWTSARTESSSPYINNLSARTDRISPNISSFRYSGHNIRCIIDTPTHSVTTSLDSHVSSVSFTGDGNTKTTTATNPTVSLLDGVTYTITTTTQGGYELANWSTTANGTLGSTTVNPTTYTISGDTTLTVISQQAPSYTVTVNLDEYTNSVSFYNADLGTQTITNQDNNGDGTHTGTVTLYRNTEYTIGSRSTSNYKLASWTSTGNATIGSTSSTVTTYTITGTATLSTTSQSNPPAASCDTPVPNITYMQDINANNYNTVMSSLTTNEAYYLRDSRDGEPYCVSKLADGKLWMLDNLALDILNPSILNILSSSNTDIYSTNESDILTSLKTGNRSAGYQYANGAIGNLTEGNSYSVARANLDYRDTVPTNTPTNGKGRNMIGGYYNFCAATAGSYCYGNDANAGTSTGNATSSICPKGWRLPTGSSSGKFSALANVIYGSTGYTSNLTEVNDFRNAFSLSLSGNFSQGLAKNQGANGYWWTSTRDDNYNMSILIMDAGTIYPTTYGGRVGGFSIRCIADTP